MAWHRHREPLRAVPADHRRHVAVMTVSLLLQCLAVFVVTSATAGLALGMALGALIHRAERRHQQHVAQLLRARSLHNPGAAAEQPAPGYRSR
jgi:hypothetical protein